MLNTRMSKVRVKPRGQVHALLHRSPFHLGRYECSKSFYAVPVGGNTESDPCGINLSVASNGEFGEGAFVSLPRVWLWLSQAQDWLEVT